MNSFYPLLQYIGDDSESIKAAVKRAITQCCIQLKSKLVRKAAMKDAADRKKSIVKYAPDVANAIAKVFENLQDPEAGDVAEMTAKFRSKEVTGASLASKLIEHVDLFDKEQALEYVAMTGRDDKTLESVMFAPRCHPSEYLAIGPVSAKIVKGEKEEHPQMMLINRLQSTI
jgi:DNA topoisomerase VI subunit B